MGSPIPFSSSGSARLDGTLHRIYHLHKKVGGLHKKCGRQPLEAFRLDFVPGMPSGHVCTANFAKSRCRCAISSGPQLSNFATSAVNKKAELASTGFFTAKDEFPISEFCLAWRITMFPMRR